LWEQEARNAKRFKALYGDRRDVLVPGMYWDYTSTKVLTMEWVEGVKLSEQQIIEEQGLNILQLVDTGIQCSLRQLLEHGFFHADPHPGNLLATPDGRLAFLDFGMMSETPESARFAIIGHVVHLVNRDYDAMARDYYALDFLSPDVDVSPIVPALQSFFDDVLTASVSELNFKRIVDGLGSVLYQFPFNGTFSWRYVTVERIINVILFNSLIHSSFSFSPDKSICSWGCNYSFLKNVIGALCGSVMMTGQTSENLILGRTNDFVLCTSASILCPHPQITNRTGGPRSVHRPKFQGVGGFLSLLCQTATD